jgi:multiple sugar transport system substrate-binding protein
MLSNAIRRLAMPLVLTAALLAGCSSGTGDKAAEDTPITLKVVYYDERSFYQQYGMLFYALHPNVEFEVVSTQSIRPEPGEDYRELMNAFIEEEKPDILMLDTNQYEQMAGEGKLVELDTRIAQEEFDVEGLLPGMVDFLRDKAGGKLYGLTPEFYSQAIYYNKDLFTEHGVPLPEDKMSWDQLLQLAARFPTDGKEGERIYGLKMGYQTSLFQMANGIGASQGLSFVNPSNKQVTINTDSWKKVFETAHAALESGALYTQDPFQARNGTTYEDYIYGDPFISGKVAMAIDGTHLMTQIDEAANFASESQKPISNWDLVTMPVDPQRPDESTNINFYNIFAINAASQNIDTAWEFIQYIHGDDYARVTSKTDTGRMPIRTKYIADEEGHRLEAFYALKPSQIDLYKGFDKLPQDFFMQFDGLATAELDAVTQGAKSISEALDSLQTNAQSMLDQAVQAEGTATDADKEIPAGTE